MGYGLMGYGLSRAGRSCTLSGMETGSEPISANTQAPRPARDYNPRLALLSGLSVLVVVGVLIIAKAYMYWQGGAASMLASLMDSVADASTALLSLLAVRYSLKPADKNHRSGHGKIEGLSALFQAILIFGTGLFVLGEAAKRFVAPVAVTHVGETIGVMVFAICASMALVFVQGRILRSAPSLAVEADRANYATDAMVNAGVIVVMGALYLGAPLWLDPLFAVFVALYLARTAIGVARKSLHMLLDRELPGAVRDEVRAIAMAQDGVLGLHDLRTSQSGMRLFFSFDIEADPDLSLRAAHDIARRVELRLFERFPNADIMIHIDPHGDPDDTRHSTSGS